MKPCPHCGKLLPEEMRFCPYCMKKLISEQTATGTPPQKRRGLLWIGGGVVLALLCALLVWGLGRQPVRPPSSSQPVELSTPPLTDDAASRDTLAGGTEDKHTTTTASGDEVGGGALTPSSSADGAGTTTKAPSSAGNGKDTATRTPSSANGTPGTGKNTTSTTKATTASTTKAPASSSSDSDPCAGGHDWETITETVRHKEVGHYEQVITSYKTVTKYKCAVCYQLFSSLDSYYTHFDEHIATSDSLVSIFRDRYETQTAKEPVYGQKWVVDKEAYTEERVIGQKCRVCGLTE